MIEIVLNKKEKRKKLLLSVLFSIRHNIEHHALSQSRIALRFRLHQNDVTHNSCTGSGRCNTYYNNFGQVPLKFVWKTF
jgi:hypothetical protein